MKNFRVISMSTNDVAKYFETLEDAKTYAESVTYSAEIQRKNWLSGYWIYIQ